MPPNLHLRILPILWSLLAILPTGTLEMKGFLPLAWFLACSVPAVQGGLLDLKSMIEKVTGKNALTNYGFYGCYCGWGGRGTPKDGTDRCGTCDMRSLFLAHITVQYESHVGSSHLVVLPSPMVSESSERWVISIQPKDGGRGTVE
nr:calcium-dependent phospholipase A2 isoform X2 [Macaca nemestrina]